METDYEHSQMKYKEELSRRENSGRTYKTILKEPTENRRLNKLREICQELAEPIYNVIDTIDAIIFSEENLLGVALTRHKTDEIALAAETGTCLEIANGKKGYTVLRVKIERASTYKCKNGQSAGRNMMFLDVSDKTNLISAVAFPDVVEENQHLLTRGNLVFLSGQKDKDSFIIKRAYAIG